MTEADNARIKRGKVSKWQKPRLRIYTNGLVVITQGRRLKTCINNPASVQQTLASWH